MGTRFITSFMVSAIFSSSDWAYLRLRRTQLLVLICIIMLRCAKSGNPVVNGYTRLNKSLINWFRWSGRTLLWIKPRAARTIDVVRICSLVDLLTSGRTPLPHDSTP